MMRVRPMLAVIVAACLCSPAFADDAERATPKTILDGTMTVNGIIMLAATLMGLVVSSLGIISYFEKRRVEAEKKSRERDDDLRAEADKKDAEFKAEARERDERMLAEISKHNETVEKRLTTLEVRTADFVPRTEIDGRLEHEKNNRQTVDASLQRLCEKADGDIRTIMIEVGGLRQQQAGTAASVERIETKIDKLQDSLNAFARKP